MNAPIQPSRLLCTPDPAERLPYVPSVSTSTAGILARWLYERSAEPQDGNQYQRDALAEQQSMQIRSERKS